MFINEKHIFYTPLYDGVLPDIDNEVLEKEIQQIKTSDPTGRLVSNRNGWQSHNICYDFLISKGCSEFNKFLERCETIIDNISAHWEITNRKEIYISNAWCNINGFGGNNVPHVHTNSIFSMVYYVKASKNSPELALMRPDAQEHYTSGKIAFDGVNNHYTGSIYRVKPVTGSFVVFPSWVQHYVETNMLQTERISIAVNFACN